MKQSSILLLLLLTLAGCKSFTHRVPDWVINPKSVYPENKYLASVGEGDTRRAAENAAAANLARIFEAHIQSDEQLHDQSRETQDSLERTIDFTTDINVVSAQTLFNLQHAEAWVAKNGRVHAIAYLNRRETAAIYRDKIDEQTSQVNFLLASIRETADPLKKYATLRSANRHAAEASNLLRQLKVIHPASVPSATPSYSLNKLHKMLADSAKEIRVQISIEGDGEQRMTSTLEEFITHYGFVIGTPAVLTIGGRVNINDTGEKTNGLVFVRYQLALKIKNAQGDTLVSINDKGREAHKTLEQARIRSFRTMENAIKAGGAQRLDQYFNTLIDDSSQ